jgi:proteasome assembly chaperone (PAC2) family protein
MVVAFEGWNDAGDAASRAVEHLQLNWDATPLAELEPDDYYDFQVSRPTVRMVDGVTRRVDWPTTRLSVCRPEGFDRDVVLVQGPEPNMRWRAFCAELLEHIEELKVSTVVTLGALLADTAHTRPVPVTGTAYDAEAASRFGLERNRYQGPTGIVGVLQDFCVQAGIPAVSIWAAVPHYVSQPPSPKATLALLHKLETSSTWRSRWAHCRNRPRSGSGPSARWPKRTRRSASTCGPSRSEATPKPRSTSMT